jgi:hypothetical protein
LSKRSEEKKKKKFAKKKEVRQGQKINHIPKTAAIGEPNKTD